MTSGSGFGRGGRGAALLKLLEQPVRRPGQQAQPSDESDSGPQPPPSLYTHPPPQKHGPVGRGFSSLQAQPSTTQPTAKGRGFVPTVSQGMGRAAALRQSPPPPSPLSPSQPSQPPPSSGKDPPTSFLARMSLRESPQAVDKIGASGQKLDLVANYIRLQGKSSGIYQHTVTYDPPEDSKNMRYKLISSPEVAKIIGKTRAFDGSTLFLPHQITDSAIPIVVTRPPDDSKSTLTITYVCMVQYANCVQLFNIIFRRILKHLEMKQVGRYYYDPYNPIAIPQHKMELWPGYISAIQQYDGGLMLMFDVSHRLMRTDSALDFLYELYESHKSGGFEDVATKQLVGCVVLTRYNNRTYRVDDIAWDKNPLSTFMDHTGKAVSFVDYYKRAYDKTIHDKEQPLLIHRPKRKDKLNPDGPQEVICLVPELCCMTGLTDYARSDFRVMKDIAVHTRVSPTAREQAFKRFVKRMKATPKAMEELDGWGLSLDSGLARLSGDRSGRCLPSEKILFNQRNVVAGDDADWSRDAVKEQQIVAVPLKEWVIVVTKRDRAKAVEFLNMMKKVTPPMGIDMKDAQLIEISNDRTDTYLQAIRSQIVPSLQLVVIVFPTSRDDRYSAVKKLCCVEKPVPSQVINSRTISAQQKLRSVTQKIALQINCKLGGELWALEIPLKNLMVVGIDVYHDSVHGKSRSITGFVASTNPYLTRWYSRVAIQGPQQEIVDGLKLCFRAALQKYHEVNGLLPDRIIVYRDGVGDGMMHTVAQYEVPQMSSCFTEMFGETYQPKMAVVVVQKRISTRIFCHTSRGLDNPPPGTVVDHTITRRGIYDFFLVSQKVRQGTVTPTHYTVVHDSSKLRPDHMQRLAYKMTHMYYNWPGTIRVPAPCQYAHKLAFLVGQSLHRDPALELADRLFFL